MKNSQKGFLVYIIIVIIALLIVGGGVYLYTKNKVEAPTIVPGRISNVSTSTELTYSSKNFGLQFNYPTKVSVAENVNEIKLSHSIPYKNYGCDMKGDGIVYERLSDFDVTVKVYSKSLSDAVKLEAPYMSADYLVDDKLVVTPGWIDSYNVGSMSGYSIYVGAEGCGYTTYYFPISTLKTLVVKRNQVQEFSGALTEDIKKKVLAVPGVIPPEEADTMFNFILSSIKLTD